MSKMSGLFTSIAAAALSLALVGGPAHAGDIVGLVTKTNTNPFFVKMKEGFEAKAKELGLTPQAYAGKFDGDNDGEVESDRAAHRGRRQGHSARAQRFDGDRADGEEGAQRRRPRHHARHAARPDHGGRRQLRDRQFQGRPADRAMGQGHARRQGRQRQDRHPRPHPEPADRRLSASQRLPRRLRHHGQGSRSTTPRATAHRSSART